MELPQSVLTVETVIAPDDSASYPPQNIAAALRRMWMRVLGDPRALTPVTIDETGSPLRCRDPVYAG